MEKEIIGFKKRLQDLIIEINNTENVEELKKIEEETKKAYNHIIKLKNYSQKNIFGDLTEIRKLIKQAKTICKLCRVKIKTIKESKQFLEKKEIKKVKKTETKKIEHTKENNDTKNIFQDPFKITLNKTQQSILFAIKNEEDLESYDLKDIVLAYSNYVLNNNVLEIKKNVEKYSKYINELLVEYLYEEGENFEEFIIMINILKFKINHTEKDTEERKIKQNDSYVKILNFWLQDEKNYLYIKELLKRKKFLCNLKVEDKHVVIYILDLYIKNYKIMLNDKNGTYINPVYLEEVYYLFTRNYFLKLSDEEKVEIDEKLKELRKYISNTLINQKRKNYAINKAKEMASKNFYKYYEDEEYEDFDEEQLCNIGFYVTTLIKNQVKETDSKEAFILGNDAYSIEEKNGLIHMIVYSINYHNFIAKDSFIDRYLYECQIKKEKVDDYFKEKMSFKVGEKYPVFAYELIFYPSGKFKELNVSKDVINITDKYVYMQSTDETKLIAELYRKSVSKNGGFYSSFDTSKLNEHFKSILENEFVEFLQIERLPFIYYGYSKTLEDEKEYNMNNLSNLLYSLDKASSREIIEIFSKDIDNYHYSNIPISNAVYDLNVLNPMNFLGMEMQRMLDDCYFNQRLYSSNERIHKLKLIYLDKYIKLVEELNKKLDYVDPNVIKMSRGKIKNRIRL